MDDIIPQDIRLLIASFLDDKTKRQMRLANTKWFKIIKYSNYNVHFTRKEDIPAIIDQLSTYSWPIKLTFSKSKFDDGSDIITHLPKLTNVTEFALDRRIAFKNVTLEQWMQLSGLTNLQVWDQGSCPIPSDLSARFTNLTQWNSREPEESVAPVLSQKPNLHELYLFGRLKTWPFALVPNPEKLETLKILAHQKIVHGDDTWNRLTNLTHFEFSDKQSARNEIKLEYLTALKHLNINNCATLLSLAANTKLEYLRLRNITTLPFLIANSNLTKLYLNCQNWPTPNLEALSRLNKLKTLELAPDEPEAPLQFQFLAHLTQLSTLFVTDYSDIDAEGPNNLYSNIPPQLRVLIIDAECDVSQLTHLTDLESLTVWSTRANAASCKDFSNLSNLTSLDLGEIGNQDFKFIEKLTRLLDLKLHMTVDQHADEPDMSNLVHLTKLNINKYPSKDSQLKYLTSLKDLTISSGASENCDFLAEFPYLESLRISCAILNANSFWQNISKLATVTRLHILEVDHDDRLLSLTSLTNLASLQIVNKSDRFTGVHFTALTSLQSIIFKCDEATAAHKREDIVNSMPYLIGYALNRS